MLRLHTISISALVALQFRGPAPLPLLYVLRGPCRRLRSNQSRSGVYWVLARTQICSENVERTSPEWHPAELERLASASSTATVWFRQSALTCGMVFEANLRHLLHGTRRCSLETGMCYVSPMLNREKAWEAVHHNQFARRCCHVCQFTAIHHLRFCIVVSRTACELLRITASFFLDVP